MLNENGRDYFILQNAAKRIKGVPGLTCEVGLREGGGSKYIIDALLENGDTGRTHITIDPFGSIPYIQSETQTRQDGAYPNKMMKRVLSELYGYVYDKDIEVLFFPLEDTEFFTRYHNGVPVYSDKEKKIINTYALTYLDGPHNLESTMAEAVFFAERSVPGSVLIFDDVENYYDHSKVKEYLENNGWKEIEPPTSKASYYKE
jgi:hypothetical protein